MWYNCIVASWNFFMTVLVGEAYMYLVGLMPANLLSLPLICLCVLVAVI